MDQPKGGKNQTFIRFPKDEENDLFVLPERQRKTP